MTRRGHAAERGFTLLEVVVAIALFALLMSIVYSGFTTAVRAYDAAEVRVNEVERMRVVNAFIRRSVGGAHALAMVVRREWALQFEGASDRLRYVADLPGYVGAGGLHELVLELQPEGRTQDLVLRRRPVVIDKSGELSGDFETRVLAEKINGIEWRFYGREDDKDEPAWRDDWASAKNMPLLVELTITPENGPAWPLLQVRPHVDSVRYVNSSNAGGAEPAEPPDTETGEQAEVDPDGKDLARDPPAAKPVMK